MSAVWFIIMLVLLFAVVAVLTSPWRRVGETVGTQTDDRLRVAAVDVEDLEAARDAKYREIRDAELDRQTGKLSDEDFRTVDAGLRAEAVAILKRLDRAQKRLDKLRGTELDQQLPQDIAVSGDEEDAAAEPDRESGGDPAGSRGRRD